MLKIQHGQQYRAKELSILLYLEWRVIGQLFDKESISGRLLLEAKHFFKRSILLVARTA